MESARGDRRICRSRATHRGRGVNGSIEGGGPHLVDRKLDLLVTEVSRYGVSVAAIQETKWFEQNV